MFGFGNSGGLTGTGRRFGGGGRLVGQLLW